MNLPLLIDILTAVASLAGFVIALYIYERKENEAPMVCPVGLDCHQVVHSDYSKFLGMRVEVLGFLYYAFVFIANALLLAYPHFNLEYTGLVLWMLSIAALLFSVYLVCVQLFIIKHWCSWCLISAFLSLVLALLTTAGVSMY